MNQGQLFVVAAASGTGKTSLVKALVKKNKNVVVSISCATRLRREAELHGRDYFFISEVEFNRMIACGEFLEYARVLDSGLYGTPKKWVLEKLNQGVDVILEIDWQGARLVREVWPQAVTIFILPPSLEALKLRLEQRRQDATAEIEKRMALAKTEISHFHEFDYLVLNDDFDTALDDLTAIIRSVRFKTAYIVAQYSNLIAAMTT